MSDILKQIQALQEQFSNLLGEGIVSRAIDNVASGVVNPNLTDRQKEYNKRRKQILGGISPSAKSSKLEDNEIGNRRREAESRIRRNVNENPLNHIGMEEDKASLYAGREVQHGVTKNSRGMEKTQMRRMRSDRSNFMNDNNSYNEIVSQIMDLKEAFSNLFEVDGDGLGQPAVDIPPSQNKIKKDVKTKNGKAELVSVEDELFPYDGNKREQYRQKILDTINGMIQGTATLEDLLQIVRQKKAPLKEAMKILEAIKDDVKNHKKYTGGTATFSYKGNDYSYTPERGLKKEGQSKDDRNPVQKVVDSSNKEFDKAREYNYNTERQSRNIGKKINKEVKKLEKAEGKGAFPGKTNDTIKKLIDTANTISANKADADKNFTEINKRQQDMADSAKGVKHQMYNVWTSKKRDNFGFKPVVQTSEALEEALSLMEDLIDMIDKAEKVGLNMKGKKAKVQNAREKEINQAAEREGTSPLKIKGRRLSNDDIVKAQQKYQKADKGSKIVRGELEVVGHDFEDKPVYMYKAPLKEAMELMEDIYDAIVKKYGKNKEGKLEGKALELVDKASKNAYKEHHKAADRNVQDKHEYVQGNSEYDDAYDQEFGDLLKKRETNKNLRGQQKTWKKQFKGDSQVTKDDGEFPDDLAPTAQDWERRRAKAAGKFKNEALEEALEIMEAIINEVSIGKWKEAAASSLPKRKEAFEKTVDNAKKSWDTYNELSKKYPEDEYALYKKAQADTEAQDGAEDYYNHAYAVTRLRTHDKANANKAIKAAKKVEDKRSDELSAKPEKRTFLRSGKANQLVAADPVKSRNEAD